MTPAVLRLNSDINGGDESDETRRKKDF